LKQGRHHAVLERLYTHANPKPNPSRSAAFHPPGNPTGKSQQRRNQRRPNRQIMGIYRTRLARTHPGKLHFTPATRRRRTSGGRTMQIAVFKRKGSSNWYYKFTRKGKTVYQSTGTEDKAQAEEIAAKAHAQLFDQAVFGNKPRYLWQDAVIRWLDESQNRSRSTELSHLRWLSQHLDDKYLDEITQDTVEAIIKAKLQEAGKTRVNRTTGIISSILNKAHKIWGWIDTVPHIRKFKEEKHRLRWLSKEEVQRLLAELPEHTKDMAIFSLATGLRESNVTHLEWNQIDLGLKIAWVHADQSKSKKLIRIPLNDDALNIIRRQRGKHLHRVFTYKGQPVEKASTKAFRQALDRAGIENACWHTLRHTWASWHVMAGTPLNALKELGGWASLDMVMVYAHLSPSYLADHANRISGLTVAKPLQSKPSEIKKACNSLF